MYYLFTKNILIQITHDIQKQRYLIGDLEFDVLPQNILKDFFSSSNWNRAFKYKPNIEVLDSKTFFIMLEIDLYLKNNNIEVLTKNAFFQNIVNQDYFKNNFLNDLIKHHFKHTLTTNKILDNESEFLNKYQPENKKDILRIESFDRFVIFDENIDLSKKKFKTLFVFKKNIEQVKWCVNSKNQLIYEIPHNLSNELINQSFAFDLNSEYFLINNISKKYSNLIFEICINNFESNKYLWKDLLNKIKTIDDEYTIWHLYNLTNDIKYINKEILESKHGLKTIKKISKIFKQEYTSLKKIYMSKNV